MCCCYLSIISYITFLYFGLHWSDIGIDVLGVDVLGDDIQAIINSEDKKSAENLIKQFDVSYI